MGRIGREWEGMGRNGKEWGKMVDVLVITRCIRRMEFSFVSTGMAVENRGCTVSPAMSLRMVVLYLSSGIS